MKKTLEDYATDRKMGKKERQEESYFYSTLALWAAIVVGVICLLGLLVAALVRSLGMAIVFGTLYLVVPFGFLVILPVAFFAMTVFGQSPSDSLTIGFILWYFLMFLACNGFTVDDWFGETKV